MTKMTAKYFYDKEIEIVRMTTEKDAEGGVIFTPGEVIGSFKGNVQYGNSKLIRQIYGLDIQVDIVITTDKAEVDLNYPIRYDGILYTVTDCKPFDSHVLIIGNKYG